MEGRASWLAVPWVLLITVAVATTPTPAHSAREIPSVLPVAPTSLGPGVAPSSGWVLVREGLVLPLGTTGSWDDFQVSNPSVLVEGAVYKMWYHGCTSSSFCQIGYATSADGKTWSRSGVVLSPGIAGEGSQIQYPNVVKVGGEYYMWYNGWDGSTWSILAANSTDGTTWTKRGVVLGPGASGGDAYAALIPHVLYENGTFRMYYTGFPSAPPTTTQIMLATSVNGFNWTRSGTVLAVGPYGAGDAYGVEAPAVAKIGSGYEMVYRGQDSSMETSLMEAVSTDGVVWQKVGVVLSPLPPNENVVGWPLILPKAAGAVDVYYAARAGGFDLQIYLASLVMDNEPPWTRVSLLGSAGDNGWYVSPVTAILTSVDNLSSVASVEYALNGGAWVTYTGPVALGNGRNVMDFRATDVANNTEQVRSATIPVDTLPPTLVLTKTAEHARQSDVTVAWTVADSISGIDHIEASVDGGAFVDVGTGNATVLHLSDGSHQVVVEAFDVAGNAAMATMSISVDTNPFSVSGPYYGIPIWVLLGVGIVLGALAIDRFARARPPKPGP